MTAIRLAEARDEGALGGKAVQLGAAIRGGLPVPDGIAFAADVVEAVGRGDRDARRRVDAACSQLAGPFAVRSSAIGEDSAAASFAGQHATFLNVQGAASDAIDAVWRSGSTESALAYRRRVGIDEAPRMGVVVQRLVAADVAGVLFTCDPVTGAAELVIEASWGLGEAIVQGLVVPDSFRVSRDGDVVSRRAGYKQLAVRLRDAGDTEHRPVQRRLVEALCLDDTRLRALASLALRCDEVFGDRPHDIEFAFQRADLFLLQRRAVTAIAGSKSIR